MKLNSTGAFCEYCPRVMPGKATAKRNAVLAKSLAECKFCFNKTEMEKKRVSCQYFKTAKSGKAEAQKTFVLE